MALQLLRWLLVDFCNQCGDDLVEVTDDSVVSGLEDARLGVAVDGGHDLRMRMTERAPRSLYSWALSCRITAQTS